MTEAERVIMRLSVNSYTLIAFSVWFCAITASDFTPSAPSIYHVDDINNGSNTTCADCGVQDRREVQLYPPKNQIRQAGENAMFRCVVPLKQQTVSGLRWTHNGRTVEESGKYHVKFYVWRQGLFTQLKIYNVTLEDTGEVTLHVPQINSTFQACLKVKDLKESTVGQPCVAQRNCFENNTFCLMARRMDTGKCLCRRDTPVYIPEYSGCFGAAHGQDICFHSEQCRFFMLGSQCVKRHCQCPVDTVVAYGACLPALGLGSHCNGTNGRCSVPMSYCADSGTCACMPDTYKKNGACHTRQSTGGISDWRTWMCYSLAAVAICGVLGHAYCHRNTIANYCKHMLPRR